MNNSILVECARVSGSLPLMGNFAVSPGRVRLTIKGSYLFDTWGAVMIHFGG